MEAIQQHEADRLQAPATAQDVAALAMLIGALGSQLEQTNERLAALLEQLRQVTQDSCK